MAELPLTVQTSYAELIEQLRGTALGRFPEGSTFRKKAVKGREYWYVQEPTGAVGRAAEKYLGPDTPEIRAAAEAGCSRARRCQRTPHDRPLPDGSRPSVHGSVVGIAPQGIVRSGSVPAARCAHRHARLSMLCWASGHPPAGRQSERTADLDLAQDYGIAVALNDRLDRPLLAVLRSVEPQFAPVPTLDPVQASASYARPGGYRVDVLTTNRGREYDQTVELPPLRTAARSLRFLDFLLKESLDATVLVDAGVLVKVPAPARYAIHKLIVAQRRSDQAKVRKDFLRAESLLDHLAVRDPFRLRDTWQEASARGKKWATLIEQGRKLLSAPIGDRVRVAVEG